MTQETNISWEEALQLLDSGHIVQAGQSHGNRATLIDDAGQRYVAQQPEIDAIIRAVVALEPEKSNRIALMTE